MFFSLKRLKENLPYLLNDTKSGKKTAITIITYIIKLHIHVFKFRTEIYLLVYLKLKFQAFDLTSMQV